MTNRKAGVEAGETTENTDAGATPADDGGSDVGVSLLEVPPARRSRPRATRAAAFREPEAPAPISRFGGVPRGVTHWGMTKASLSGSWDVLPWAEPGETIADREWPISTLSEEVVERRWGLGSYRVFWVMPTENGGRRVIRSGVRTVDIVARRPVETSTPAPVAAPSAPSAFGEALEMMGLIKSQAAADLEQTLRLAQVLTGGGSRGIGGEELRAILRDERDAATRAHAAELQAIESRFAARIEELEESDDEPGSGLAGVALSAVPRIKGSGWGAFAMNLIRENPEVAKEIAAVALPVVGGVVTQVLSVLERVTKAPPAPPVVVTPAPPAPRPRAEPRAAAEPEPAAKTRANGSPWAPLIGAEPAAADAAEGRPAS